MTILSQLEFKKVEGNAPGSFNCHWCSSKASKEWQIAELRPFINESADMALTVCSDHCKSELLKFKDIEKALSLMILNIVDASGEDLKEEYLKHIQKQLLQSQ